MDRESLLEKQTPADSDRCMRSANRKGVCRALSSIGCRAAPDESFCRLHRADVPVGAAARRRGHSRPRPADRDGDALDDAGRGPRPPPARTTTSSPAPSGRCGPWGRSWPRPSLGTSRRTSRPWCPWTTPRPSIAASTSTARAVTTTPSVPPTPTSSGGDRPPDHQPVHGPLSD